MKNQLESTMNLTQTQQNAKEAYLNQQSEQMLVFIKTQNKAKEKPLLSK